MSMAMWIELVLVVKEVAVVMMADRHYGVDGEDLSELPVIMVEVVSKTMLLVVIVDRILTVIMVIMMYALVLVVKTMTMVLMVDRY